VSDDWFLKSSVSYRNIIVGIRHYDQSSESDSRVDVLMLERRLLLYKNDYKNIQI
jgi:hypothetical protein